jgi:hypothetical protein
MSVKRLWHGWTTPENADTYQELLHREIFPGIEAREIEGYHCVELFRRDLDKGSGVRDHHDLRLAAERELISRARIMQKLMCPIRPGRFLKRWDQEAEHYDAVEKRTARI